MPDDRKEPRGGRDGRKGRKWWIYIPALLVFVSITSFIAGTRIGRDTDQHLGQMLDTIILSPEARTVEENRIDFSGQIWCADGTPYANRLLELHSEPVRTVTDSEGFFYFQNVEVGEHILTLLDESGSETGRITVVIGRDQNVPYGKMEHDAGSCSLAVSEQVIEVYIRIWLDGADRMTVEPEIYTRKQGEEFRDSSGREQGTRSSRQIPAADRREEPIPESGEGLVDRGNESEAASSELRDADLEDRQTAQDGSGALQESQAPAETGAAMSGSQTAASSQTGSQTAASSQTESQTVTAGPQESTAAASTADGGSGGGSDSGSSGNRPTKPTDPTKPIDPVKPTDPPEPLDVSVQEKGGPVWSQNTTISLFADRTGAGSERKLLPGSRGSYAFLVSNRNSYGVIYRMSMSAPDGQFLLPLRYRLKCGDEYVCGDDDTWLTAEQLAAYPVELASGAENEYLLEWQWQYNGGDDAYDTQIGTAADLEYHVIVTITIEQIVS